MHTIKQFPAAMGRLFLRTVPLFTLAFLLALGVAAPTTAFAGTVPQESTESAPEERTTGETGTASAASDPVSFGTRHTTPSRYNPNNTTGVRGHVEIGSSYPARCWIRGQSVLYHGVTSDKWIRIAGSGNYVLSSAFHNSYDDVPHCSDGGPVARRMNPDVTTSVRAHPSNQATQRGVVSPNHSYGLVCYLTTQNINWNGISSTTWYRLESGNYVTRTAFGQNAGLDNCRWIDG